MPFQVSLVRCSALAFSDGAQAGLTRSPARRFEVCRAHDQAGRAVANQSSAEPAESQARTRPYSMDGDRIRHGNGFPCWVPNASDCQLSDVGRCGLADRPQTSEDVSALGPKPQPEELL